MFGSALLRAQLFLLAVIPAGSNILIVGGGSGWILEAIAGLYPAGLSITYIDASAKMVALAEKRNAGVNKVTFITTRIEDAEVSGQFAAIVTPFFFDNFEQAAAGKIFTFLHRLMDKNGTWLWCDFRNTNSLMQRIVLKLMYRFFRLFCGIEARRLPDMNVCFEDNGYVIMKSQRFMKGFVESVVYKKTTD